MWSSLPRVSGTGFHRGAVGSVGSSPAVSAGRPSIEQPLAGVNRILLVLVVMTNPLMRNLAAFWLIIGLGLLWLLARVGLLGGLGFLFGVFRGLGGRDARWQPPSLSFRCQFPTGTREVRLRGFDSGVQLGDQVEVSGVSVRGVIDASRVVNRTTGAVLRRHGLTRLVALCICCLWLLVCFIAQVA